MKKLLRGVEHKLEDLMRLGRKHPATEPLDIRGEVLEHIDDRIAGGRREPALHVVIAVERARLAEARDLFRDFETQVREHLRVRGRPGAGTLGVRVGFRERRDEKTAAWEVRRDTRQRADAPPTTHRGVWLVAKRGEIQSIEQPIRRRRINLGRGESVSVARRAPRQNHVWFGDGADTVSRSHAHIEASADGWFLFDDKSQWTTRVIRNGDEIPIERGSARGVPLHHGDVIELGKGHALEFRTAEPGDEPAAG